MTDALTLSRFYRKCLAVDAHLRETGRAPTAESAAAEHFGRTSLTRKVETALSLEEIIDRFMLDLGLLSWH
jgi:hypothetical protein